MHSPPPPPVSTPVPPVGFGGAGGAFGVFEFGGGGVGGDLGLGVTAVEPPLTVEAALPPLAATKEATKKANFFRDKRTPIRGSLFAKGKGKTIFVPHAASNAAPVGDGSLFVVAASTGLWLHQANDLTKSNRLVAAPIRDVAASPNGSKIAYVFADGRLRVVTYPGLTSILSLKVDIPTRMRFSQDGQRLALGSDTDNVTLVDVAPGATPKIVETDQDVNDVFPMPDKPNEVAYASDDDEVVVVDVSTNTRIFGSEQLVESWRRSKSTFFLMRDQLVVGYDSITDTLLGGGDDNMFWRFSNFRTSPKVENPIELGGNVVDLACCAGRTSKDRAAFVATDNGQVHTIGLDGRMGPKFGPLVENVMSNPVRISLLPSGDVLVIAYPAVFRWEPRSGTTWQSNDYAAPLPLGNAIEADSIYVQCDADACVVHRVKHGPTPVADVETTIVGDVPGGFALTVLRFATGLRAIVIMRNETLQMAYLPVGEALEELIDTKVKPRGHFAEKDSSTHGYVDPSGKVYEIVAVPRGMRAVGAALGKGFITGLSWDSSSRKWRVGYAEGPDVLVP